VHNGALPPCSFIKGATGAKVLFCKRIIGNFMFYQDRIETKLLELIAHPET